MRRREFVFKTALADTGLLFAGGLNSCVGTYNPKIINALWNEKLVFDSPDLALLMRQLVLCGVIAPSGHNTQPWLFRIAENKIEILPDFSRRLPVVDSDNRELFISLGAALENILLSASSFGFTADYEIDDSEGGKIIINLSRTEAEKSPLLQPMFKRQVTRNVYKKGNIPAQFQKDISGLKGKDTALLFSTEAKTFDTFIDYVKEGNRLLMKKAGYLNELKKWIRWNDSEAEEKLDGLYIRALGEPSTAAWFGKMIFNLSVTEKTQNKKDSEQIRSSSGLLFLFSEDDMEHWIEAGRHLERSLIQITDAGMKFAFHNQPCQVAQLRKSFAADLGHKGLMPQAAIRLGYSESMPRSPRRKINVVIVD